MLTGLCGQRRQQWLWAIFREYLQPGYWNKCSRYQFCDPNWGRGGISTIALTGSSTCWLQFLTSTLFCRRKRISASTCQSKSLQKILPVSKKTWFPVCIVRSYRGSLLWHCGSTLEEWKHIFLQKLLSFKVFFSVSYKRLFPQLVKMQKPVLK